MKRRWWGAGAVVVLVVVVSVNLMMAEVTVSVGPVTGSEPQAWTLQQYPLPGAGSWPQAITADGAGNLWFVEAGADQVGRLAPAQATPGTSNGITEYPLSLGAWPQGIAANSAVWFAEFLADALGEISAGGAVTEHQVLPAGSHPVDVVIAGDGSIWTAEADSNALGRFRPATNTFEQLPLPVPDAYPSALALDGAGNVWFAASSANQIGVYNPGEDTMTLFDIPTPDSFPNALAIAAGGAIWFSEEQANKIARLDPTSGQIVEFAVPTAGAMPKGLAIDRNGRIWFAESMADKIAVFEPATQVFSEYSLPAGACPEDVVPLNGAIWVTLGGIDGLARLVVQPSTHPRRLFLPVIVSGRQ